jgi:hypothetical protein
MPHPFRFFLRKGWDTTTLNRPGTQPVHDLRAARAEIESAPQRTNSQPHKTALICCKNAAKAFKKHPEKRVFEAGYSTGLHQSVSNPAN